jgi:exodeoxyribonuclease VII small subunit
MAKTPASPVNAAEVPLEAGLPSTYEEAQSELDKLVSQMESGQLPLDDLLASYQRGAQLLKFCRGRLEAVEAQVKLLEDGQTKPWDAA